MILCPMLTSAVRRNFTGSSIWGKDGVLNNLLLHRHRIGHPLRLLYTNTAIVIGSVYLFLPIMVTSLMGSSGELNIEVEEAAAVLGAMGRTAGQPACSPVRESHQLEWRGQVFSSAVTLPTAHPLCVRVELHAWNSSAVG